MIKVDISKAIPSTAFNYLAPFIPGLFFEISVLMGNPVLIRTLVRQSYAGYALGYYTSLTIAVILAFVVGNGFMLFLRLFQRPIVYAYLLKTALWKQIIKLLILPSLKRLWQKPGWQRSPWLNGLLRYAQMEVLQFPPSSWRFRDAGTSLPVTCLSGAMESNHRRRGKLIRAFGIRSCQN
jgi:hypothetical protein